MTSKQKNELITLLTDVIQILEDNQEKPWLIALVTSLLGILSATIKTKG